MKDYAFAKYHNINFIVEQVGLSSFTFLDLKKCHKNDEIDKSIYRMLTFNTDFTRCENSIPIKRFKSQLKTISNIWGGDSYGNPDNFI